MKEPGTYTLSNGQVVTIVSAELVSETIKVTVESDEKIAED